MAQQQILVDHLQLMQAVAVAVMDHLQQVLMQFLVELVEVELEQEIQDLLV
jgi:hypothetical protein